MSPWSGRLRHENGNTSSSVWTKERRRLKGLVLQVMNLLSFESLDEEFGIPIVRTPGVSSSSSRLRHARYVPPHARRVR